MNLMAIGKTKRAIDILLKTVSSDSRAYKELIITSRRYEKLVQHEIRMTMHPEVVAVERNKIAYSLIEIVQSLENEEFEQTINAKFTLKKNRPSLWNWILRIWKKIFG